MQKSLLFSIWVILFISVTSCGQGEIEMAQFRGANRSGVYSELGLLQKWPEKGPDIIFTTKGIGIGHSSPAVTNSMIYITGMIDSTGYIYCFDKTGNLQWKTEYGREWTGQYPGVRATPTVYGDKLYFLTSYGKVLCLETKKGNILWKVDLLEKYGVKNPFFGMVESLLIVDEKLIVTPGGKEANMIALNLDTGKEIWKSPGKGEEPAYCSPVLANHNNIKMIITMTLSSIVGIGANNGKLLWSYPYNNKWSVHANSPIYYNGSIYCVSGYSKGGVKLQLSDDGTNVTKVWENTTLDCEFSGAILVDGNIYGSGREKDRALQCIDWETGELKYKTDSVKNGTTFYADGMIYFYEEKGGMYLIEPGKSGFKIISSFKINLGKGTHWSHPTINDGVLYIRHNDALMAYNIKKTA